MAPWFSPATSGLTRSLLKRKRSPRGPAKWEPLTWITSVITKLIAPLPSSVQRLRHLQCSASDLKHFWREGRRSLNNKSSPIRGSKAFGPNEIRFLSSSESESEWDISSHSARFFSLPRHSIPAHYSTSEAVTVSHFGAPFSPSHRRTGWDVLPPVWATLRQLRLWTVTPWQRRRGEKRPTCCHENRCAGASCCISLTLLPSYGRIFFFFFFHTKRTSGLTDGARDSRFVRRNRINHFEMGTVRTRDRLGG